MVTERNVGLNRCMKSAVFASTASTP
nr:hypothetical protein [Sicyoidochytrium minutum DNA virus]